LSGAEEQGVMGGGNRGHTATSDSLVSSGEMSSGASYSAPTRYQVQNQTEIATKKRQSSLRIFSAHITRNAIEIVVSAPLGSRALIS